MILTMRKDGVHLPEEFNAKTKLVPDWTEVEGGLREEMRRIEEGLEKKRGEGKKKTPKLGEAMEWGEVRRVYEEMVEDCGGEVKESTIEKCKERTTGFVVAPVDKCNQEMAIV